MPAGDMFDRAKSAATGVRDTAYKAGGGEIDEETGTAKGGRQGVLAGAEDTAYGLTGGTVESEAPANLGATAGFPTGNFKIRNEETGHCLEAARGTTKQSRWQSDAKGNLKERDPEGGRGGSYMALQPCRDTPDQVWRYDLKTKRLVNVGNEGRVAWLTSSHGSMGSLTSMDSFTSMDGEQTTDSAPRADNASWELELASPDMVATDKKKFQFKTVDGYIMRADTQGPRGKETYWTAESGHRGLVSGRAKGRAGQKWTFTTVA